jgi:hypothetical protein
MTKFSRSTEYLDKTTTCVHLRLGAKTKLTQYTPPRSLLERNGIWLEGAKKNGCILWLSFEGTKYHGRRHKKACGYTWDTLKDVWDEWDHTIHKMNHWEKQFVRCFGELPGCSSKINHTGSNNRHLTPLPIPWPTSARAQGLCGLRSISQSEAWNSIHRAFFGILHCICTYCRCQESCVRIKHVNIHDATHSFIVIHWY